MKGKIQQWNDDKGYGFIQIENSDKRIFAHISAFSQKQPRPEIGEIVSFDTATNQEGKMAAKNVRYLNRTTPETKNHTPRNNSRKNRQPEKENGLIGTISLFVGAIVVGLIGYQIYQFVAVKTTPKQENTPIAVKSIPQPNTAQYRCDGRQHCSQMTSCEEAKFFIRNCADTKMDGDGDGIPCEGQGNLCGY